MGLPEYHHRQETAHHSKTTNYPQLSRKFVARRISEGETGRLKEELKCQACGKGYKHVSSLAKHLWEHTPEWNVTSKLLISKHQQVQLLEAASILVSMNEEDEDEQNDENADEDKQDQSASDRASSEAIEDSATDSGCSSETSPEAAADVSPLPQSQQEQQPQPEQQPQQAETSVEAVPVQNPVSQRLAVKKDEKYLTPAHEIPILSTASRPIAKTPARNVLRRRSSANQHQLAGSFASSFGSSYPAAGPLDALRQASPLPESLLARDLHNAASGSARRRRTSTLVPSSVPRHSAHLDSTLNPLDDDEEYEADGNVRGKDGLQDPHEHDLDTPRTPKYSPRPRKVSPKKEEVFGMEF